MSGSLINDIAGSYTGYGEGDYSGVSIPDKAELLEEYLISICSSLSEVSKLTEGKANVEYLLSIVGSYLLGIQSEELDLDVTPPKVLFEESLYPSLDAMLEEEITVEVIDDEEQINRDGEDSSDDGGDVTTETAN